MKQRKLEPQSVILAIPPSVILILVYLHVDWSHVWPQLLEALIAYLLTLEAVRRRDERWLPLPRLPQPMLAQGYNDSR